MAFVKVETGEDVALVTIDRPEALNALNKQVIEELLRVVEQLETDRTSKVVVITGAGSKAFVAGADVREMRSMDVMQARAFSRRGNELMMRIENMPKPSIAAVNGYALGGGLELALACDLRVAADTAQFGLPEVGLGIFPGFGATQRLPRLVGKARAKELIFTGDRISAQRALEIGLVNMVVPAAELMERVMELARKIASKSTVAIALGKQALSKGLDTDLATGCALESEIWSQCFATQDQKEGMAAFLERRQPRFPNC
ncbi:MAG: enoyl-CoA hydratase/isomerase family protein [Bacillota bacterium]